MPSKLDNAHGDATARQFLDSHKLEFVRVVFTDLHGSPRGKTLTAAEFLRRSGHQVRFCQSAFATDVLGNGAGRTGLRFESGFRDVVAVPDPSTYRVVPGSPKLGQVIADLYRLDGSPLPYDPRRALRRVLDLAATLRVAPRVASELEFYVLPSDSLKPTHDHSQLYGLPDGARYWAFLSEAMSGLEALDLPVEGVLCESGTGQFEINLRYSAPLPMADWTVFAKLVVKDTARRHGYIATFMPKPFAELPGSGFHLHQSLWDPSCRANLFASGDGAGPSQTALHYLAGQLRHLRAASAFFLPSVNAYKRVCSTRFRPSHCTWGVDNRSAALRMPECEGPGCRIENRVPSADANPYLVIAGSLATGLLGLQSAQPPPEPIRADVRGSPESMPLPRSLSQSLTALREDTLLRDTIGPDLVRLFTALKQPELSAYRRHVSDWERGAYLVRS